MTENKHVLTVHASARERFNALGVDLKSNAKLVTPPPPPPKGWVPDLKITHHITSADVIGPVRTSETKQDGGLVLASGSQRFELTSDQVAALAKLCSGLHAAVHPRGSVARETVSVLVNEWLVSGVTDTLTDYCLPRLQALVKHFVVWVPVAGLYVQTSFQVGHVTLQELSAAQIQEWHRSPGYEALSAEEKPHVDAYYAKFAKDHQGHAIATAAVFGEKNQVRATALSMVEDALAMLRFFSGPSLIPTFRSLCTPCGRERKEGYVIILEEVGKYAGEQRGLLDGETARNWALGTDELSELKKSGLDRLSDLLRQAKRSEFEEKVLAAVKLYAESTLETRPHIKLVFMLGALEGVFLGNANEPIQQNLGERLALVTEQEFEKRRAVPKLVREVYSLRSRFVHHAEQVENEELLRPFFRTAWFGMIATIENSSRFNTVRDFTDAIDANKFRSPN